MCDEESAEALTGMDAAGRTLWRALERDEAAYPPDLEEDEEAAPGPMTLNDLALAFMQLETHNLVEMVRFGDALEALSMEVSLTEDARDCLQRSQQAFKSLMNEEASEADDALSAMGREIEAAMTAMAGVELGVNRTDKAVKPAPLKPPLDAPVDSEPVSEGTSKATPPTSLMPDDGDPDLLEEFITECLELIEGAEAALLEIEADPEQSEAINTVFRAFHTIKGMAGFLGIFPMSGLAHRAESLPSRARDGEICLTGGYAELSLQSADLLKALLLELRSALRGGTGAVPTEWDALMTVLADPESAGVCGESLLEGPAAFDSEEETASVKPAEPTPEQSLPVGIASRVESANGTPSAPRAAVSEHAEESSVRVRTDRLDSLIEMVGELVIAQSMVAQDRAVMSGQQLELTPKVAHSGKIVRELQDLSMSMRMVPLKPTFQKMARLARDAAQKCGKQVEFVTEGDDTEIDRNMVDVVRDPLVHMVRNAVDHGIETPQEREAKGKPRLGRVSLSAYRSGEKVVVEIRDDGNGLDREKLIAKALQKGLIDSDKNLSDAEAFDLIFAPGFSTAEQVTDLSGRGVGMDVVRQSINALRGRVEIQSELGKGSTFSMRLPLTLAITDGMLIRIGEERYIVPTANIFLSFRPTAEMLSTVAGRGELVMLRGDLMPVFRLHRLFRIAGAVEDATQGLLVVIGGAGRRCALLVDELLGQQQVVAKALGEGVGKVQGVSGGAILGDGRVGLILDTEQIMALARQGVSEGGGRLKRLQNAA